MNEKLVKKLRQYTKRHGQDWVAEVKSWPFSNRLRFCWHIMFGEK